MSHSSARRCCRGMDLTRRGGVAAPAVLPAPGVVPGSAAGRAGRKERGSVSVSVRGAVRADLDEIFRRDYQLVVGVAARVLGSRDQAEDVAQDVFLSFGHSSVPAGEARGWLCVAAAHTALNLLRSGRRRASREETAAAADNAVVSDVAETVVTTEERNLVRSALARLPRK